eukprot:scaffold117280_cov18-Tisochrysis_lutea.AAC.1
MHAQARTHVFTPTKCAHQCTVECASTHKLHAACELVRELRIIAYMETHDACGHTSCFRCTLSAPLPTRLVVTSGALALQDSFNNPKKYDNYFGQQRKPEEGRGGGGGDGGGGGWGGGGGAAGACIDAWSCGAC